MKFVPELSTAYLVVHCALLCGASEFRQSMWRKMTSKQWVATPVAATAVTLARSSLECAKFCTTYAGDCAASAYTEKNRTCLLFEQMQSSSGTLTQPDGGKMDIFAREAWICLLSDAEGLVENGSITSQQASLTSVDGDVTCDDGDYLYSNAEPPDVECRKGQWTRRGDCRQRIWRNGTVTPGQGIFYPIPRAPSVGWTVCLVCVLEGTERWVVNFQANEDDILFHFEPVYQLKKYTNLTILNYRLGGVVWKKGNDRPMVTDPPFPFLPYEEVSLRIKFNSTYEALVYVGGRLYTNFTMALPVSNLTMLNFMYQARIVYLDLWCSG